MRVPKDENGFHDEYEVADRTDFHFDGDDEMIDDNDVADQMKIEAFCASGSCKSMPSKQIMEIKVYLLYIKLKYTSSTFNIP